MIVVGVILFLVLHIGAIVLMGAIILDKLASLSLAIDALQGRIGNQSGITTAEAQQIADGVDAATGRINALLA